MTFILRRSSPYVLALFPLNFGSNPDTPVVKTYINKNPSEDNGYERLKNIFTRSEYGELSPELTYCMHLSTMGLMMGGLYGGVIRGRTAFVNFIDHNEATMFRNHLDAKRKLQDSVTLSAFKGAFQWGWRTCYFTSIYTFTSTAISVYRGKSGVIEHIDAGLIAGGIYNLKNGIRGFIVGGGLGGVLGAFFGSIFYGILVMSGKTIEEVRFWSYEWKNQRDEAMAKISRDVRMKEEADEIVKITNKMTEKEYDRLLTKND